MAQQEYTGHFSAEAQGWMARRSQAFQRATSRWPGKQMSYGVGKGPLWSEGDRVVEEAKQAARDSRS